MIIYIRRRLSDGSGAALLYPVKKYEFESAQEELFLNLSQLCLILGTVPEVDRVVPLKEELNLSPSADLQLKLQICSSSCVMMSLSSWWT